MIPSQPIHRGLMRLRAGRAIGRSGVRASGRSGQTAEPALPVRPCGRAPVRPVSRWSLLLVGALSVALPGCTEETPTDIGGPLLPGTDVRTFEVILEPDQYLENDTAFSGYTRAIEAPFLLVAQNFEGVVNANTLVRFGRPPASLQARDSAGTVRTDTLPSYPTGVLVLFIDTARSRGAATLGVYRTDENWDAVTATWTVRSDTGGVRELWQTPGGTRGALLGTADWQPGLDSLRLPLDSAQIAAITGVDEVSRGALITLDQTTDPNGSRLSLPVVNATLRLSGHSTIQPDTVFDVNVELTNATFIFTPDPPTIGGATRVSGVPAWRTFVSLREDLADFTVPCPSQPAPCRLALRDLHLNVAQLLLRPTASPAGFSPEDSIIVSVRAAIEGTNVPLSRFPVAGELLQLRRPLAPSRFTGTDTGPDAVVTVTALVGALLADTATTAATRSPRRMVLLTSPESATFGFASFLAGPRLRLVLTTAEQ